MLAACTPKYKWVGGNKEHFERRKYIKSLKIKQNVQNTESSKNQNASKRKL